MTFIACAVLVFSAGIVAAVLRELVHEEIRGWLDYLPHAILGLAASRLDADQRVAVYQDEWLPELCYILKGAGSRPITRLMRGLTYSVGLLTSAGRLRRHLHRPSAHPPAEVSTRKAALSPPCSSLAPGAVMRLAHLEPLTPYPGAAKPWRSRCGQCTMQVAATLSSIRNGRGCPNCGGR